MFLHNIVFVIIQDIAHVDAIRMSVSKLMDSRNVSNLPRIRLGNRIYFDVSSTNMTLKYEILNHTKNVAALSPGY
jgi:hypothetical protein